MNLAYYELHENCGLFLLIELEIEDQVRAKMLYHMESLLILASIILLARRF